MICLYEIDVVIAWGMLDNCTYLEQILLYVWPKFRREYLEISNVASNLWHHEFSK